MSSALSRSPPAADADSAMGRMLWQGALAWLLFSALHVLVSGVVVDEAAEAAQVISGAVQYPPGHPLPQFFMQVFSLPNLLAAGFHALVPDPLLVSALRNIGFLFLSVFIPYGLAVVLVRKPLWGHAAACMALLGISVQYAGNYPAFVFPTYYSHGHYGFYLALLVVVLVLGRQWATSGFLAGVLPAIHPVMALLVWPWVGLRVLFARERPAGRARSRFLYAGLLGLAVCCGFALAHYLVAPVPPPAAPYDSAVDAARIAANLTRFGDAHNFPVEPRSMGYLANPVTFLLLCLWLLYAGRGAAGEETAPAPAGTDSGWVLALGVLIWALIISLEVLRAVTGWWPDAVYMLMPARFSNLTAILIAPLLATSLAVALGGWAPGRRPAGVLLAGGLLLAAGAWLLFDRTPVAGNLYYLLFALVFALPAANPQANGTLRFGALLAVVAMTLVFWLAHDSGRALWLAAAWLVLWGVLRAAWWLPSPRPASLYTRLPGRVLLPLSLLLIATASLSSTPLLRGKDGYTRGDGISAFDRELAAWLARNANDGELLVPNILPVSHYMAKTGHPVLFDLGTRAAARYMPELAPAIGTLIRDLYGYDYGNTAWLEANTRPGRVDLRPLADSWVTRTPDEWQRLGARYGFRLVLSTRAWPLDLPVLLAGEKWVLYGIP